MSLYKVMQQAVNFMCLAMCLLRFVQDRSDPTRLPLGQRAGACYMIILWSYYDLIWFALSRKTTHFETPARRAQRSRQQSHDVTCQSFKPLLGTGTNQTVGSDPPTWIWFNRFLATWIESSSSVNKIDWSFWEIEDLPRLRFRFLFKSSQGWCWCYVRGSA